MLVQLPPLLEGVLSSYTRQRIQTALKHERYFQTLLQIHVCNMVCDGNRQQIRMQAVANNDMAQVPQLLAACFGPSAHQPRSATEQTTHVGPCAGATTKNGGAREDRTALQQMTCVSELGSQTRNMRYRRGRPHDKLTRTHGTRLVSSC